MDLPYCAGFRISVGGVSAQIGLKFEVAGLFIAGLSRGCWGRGTIGLDFFEI